MKIIDYAFCSGKNTFELIEDVGAALINGFQPYYSPHLSHSSCVQIMVKYETEKESFDKSTAEEIKKLSEDLNEKLFSELLKTSIKENELLRDVIKGFIKSYSRYNTNDGYFVFINSDDYYSKSHENHSTEILESILEHRKRISK
jgi:hypothetical protein